MAGQRPDTKAATKAIANVRQLRLLRNIRHTIREGHRVCAGSSGHGTLGGWWQITSADATKMTLNGWTHVYAEVTPENGLRVIVELTVLGALLADDE